MTVLRLGTVCGSMEQQQSKSASARPITADEIVRIQEERKRKAAGALGKGPPSKTGRLDNSSLLAAASKRRAGAFRHGPAVSAWPLHHFRGPHAAPRLHSLLRLQDGGYNDTASRDPGP